MDQACVSQLKGQCWPCSLVSSGSPFQGDLEERKAVLRDVIGHGSRGVNTTGESLRILPSRIENTHAGSLAPKQDPLKSVYGESGWTLFFAIQSLGLKTFRYKGIPLGREHTGETSIPRDT